MKNIYGVLILALVFCNAKLMAQQAGALDLTFNAVGYVTTAVGTYGDEVRALAIQPDGKILAAGFTSIGEGINMAVVRYNTDGTLDDSFGEEGIFVHQLSGNSGFNAIALQPDGRIVLGGYFYNGMSDDLLLVRLNTDGTFDEDFAGTGYKNTDILGYDERLFGIAVQPDGKIVVGGTTSDGLINEFIVGRYNADGSKDNTFGEGGFIITSPGEGYSAAYAMVLQPDGKIVLGGYAEFESTWEDFALVRYNSDGSPDVTFNTSGMVYTDFYEEDDNAFALTLQPDGKIVAAGYAYADYGADMAIARYNTDGSLDNTFGSGGKLTIDFYSNDDEAWAIALQSDGKMVTGGDMYSYESEESIFELARNTADGSLDASFGTDGLVTTDINWASEYINALAIQSDGKIVAGGTVVYGANSDFIVARYLSGLEVGIADAPGRVNSFLVYPNPVSDQARLQYELASGEFVTVEVSNAGGQVMMTCLDHEWSAAGLHYLNVPFTDEMNAGNYLVRMITPQGIVNIKVVKQ
ncbi:MAG: T9SS type A sorting domain-containing protein [Bacteroidetes bacterium]|nr:T9SS type A sorting domain-containing protein [Bacteroidota bacterium]